MPVMRVASLSTLPMMQTPPELRRLTCHLLKNNSNFGEQGSASTLLFKLIHKNYQKKIIHITIKDYYFLKSLH